MTKWSRVDAQRDEERTLSQDASLQYRTKAELIYEHLRGEILEGRPTPGSRLVVDQIAERLGVSKVPVREAITRLTAEGWLEVRPHAGPVLPVITPAEIRETALIRSSLESTAIEAAAEHHDASTLAALADLLSRMDNAVESFPRLNLELHTAVIEPAPYPTLKSMAIARMERALHYQTVHRVPGYLDQAQIEHRQIVESLTAGDAQRASELTRRHILTAAEHLASSLEEH